MADLFRIAFMEMRCLAETSESSASDEPYAVFWTADLHGAIPKAEAFRTKVFEDTDEGELKKQWVRIWGVDGKAATIADPNKVIILVSLLEHDYSDPNAVVTVSRALLFGNLLTHVSAGLSHDQMVSKLITDFNVAVNTGKKTALSNEDDRIGQAQELRLSTGDLAAAKTATKRKNLVFSGDGGKYRLGFDIAAGA